MKNKRIILMLTLCLLAGLLAVRGQQVLTTRHVSTANGLSNDFVVEMALDGMGYVWVGTESGVSRIAGSRCTVFQTSKDARHKPIVSLLYHKASQQMMMSTEGHNLSIYDCRKGEMRQMTKDDGLLDIEVEDLANAADGGVWVVYSFGQVQKMNVTTGLLTSLPLGELHSTRCALDDGNGWLYMGHSQHGMTMVDTRGQGARRYVHEPGNPKSLPGNNVRKIVMDSQKRIWVGTDHGLALFHPDSGTFDKVTDQQTDWDDNVYDICEMEDGRIWVALDLGGVKVVNGLYYEDTKVATSSINVRAIVSDEFGNVWVGNHSTGVDFIASEESLFHLLDYKSATGAPVPVSAMCSREGYLWTGSQDELVKWQDGRPLARIPTLGTTSRQYNFIRTMMADSHDNLWVGIDDQGVYRLDRQTGRLAQVSIGRDGCDIHAFAEDEKGRIWIGSEVGVFTWADGLIQRQESIEEMANHLPVTSFVWLDCGRQVISTIGAGLHIVGGGKLDASNGLPSSKINEVIKDDDIGLWLATYDGLVHVRDAQHLEGISTYDHRQGLADNHIRALKLDGRGRVWLSTYSGISCFDPKTKHFYNYNQFDNQYLSGFSIGAAAKDYADRLFFASAQGVCYFSPLDFDSETRISQVQIVSCEAYNPVGSDTEILTLTPDADNCVYTNHRQNTLRLLFAVRNAAQNGHEEYAYMMKGMNDHWYYIGNDQEVVFRGLPPGNYTFVLRAKLKEQDWEDASQTEISIQILPPLWRRWWAYLIYALLAGAGCWYVFQKYLKRKLPWFRESY